MILRIREVIHRYPRQFWLISIIMMFAWLFHSVMWPYLLLYISQKMNASLSSITWLMTLNALVGMFTTFLGGTVADRFGRKGVMVFSIIFSGIGWFFFTLAGVELVFAVLMAINGATTPLYRLAADSMVADLIPDEDRLDAYSVLRMGNNLGVAAGPSIGGLLSSISYSISFTVIGAGLVIIGIFIAVLARETKPVGTPTHEPSRKPARGYGTILKDKTFMTVLGGLTLNRACTSVLWLLLAVYAKQNYGLNERLFGIIPTTNAVMVILFQLAITRWVNRCNQERSMTLGALLYAVSIFCVAFGQGFWGFWVCMVVATIGEMILVPTTTTFTSRIAPADMRARYMGAYTLTWGIGTGIGPLVASLAGDAFGPKFMWYTAGLIGFAGALVFLRLVAKNRKTQRSLSVRS